jgi:hypothetical protein
MRKTIAILLLIVLVCSCGPVPESPQTVVRGKDTFDLVQNKAIVSGCELISPVSVHDEINPRYRILTTDSLVFKSPREFSIGDTIDVRVYKKRK